MDSTEDIEVSVIVESSPVVDVELPHVVNGVSHEASQAIG